MRGDLQQREVFRVKVKSLRAFIAGILIVSMSRSGYQILSNTPIVQSVCLIISASTKLLLCVAFTLQSDTLKRCYFLVQALPASWCFQYQKVNNRKRRPGALMEGASVYITSDRIRACGCGGCRALCTAQHSRALGGKSSVANGAGLQRKEEIFSRLSPEWCPTSRTGFFPLVSSLWQPTRPQRATCWSLTVLYN